jgi:hypothetical protein
MKGRNAFAYLCFRTVNPLFQSRQSVSRLRKYAAIPSRLPYSAQPSGVPS